MSQVVIALFKDSTTAGDAIAELKNKGYTKDISVLAKDDKAHELSEHDVKQDVSDTAGIGAAVGAAAGAIWAGLSAVALPGLGLLVGGPLAALITGALAGAATGGLVGALVDLGLPEDLARDYENRLKRGEVAVGVTTSADRMDDAHRILKEKGGQNVRVIDKEDRV